MVHPENFFEVFKSIPSRMVWLLWKIISFQGLVFITATILTAYGKLDSYVWVITAIMIIFGRASLDVIREIKR